MHLSDEDLIQLVSAAGGEEFLAETTQRHIGSCLACQARLAQLSESWGAAMDQLALLDVPAPVVDPRHLIARARARRRQHFPRAAAAGLVLLLSAMGVAAAVSPPFRAWVAAGFDRADALGVPSDTDGSPTSTDLRSAGGIAFEAPSSLAISVRGADSGGVLSIRIESGTTVRLASEGPDVGFFVDRTQVRVTALPGSPLGLTLTLPPTLAELTVTFGDQLVLERRGGVWAPSLNLGAPGDRDSLTVKPSH